MRVHGTLDDSELPDTGPRQTAAMVATMEHHIFGSILCANAGSSPR